MPFGEAETPFGLPRALLSRSTASFMLRKPPSVKHRKTQGLRPVGSRKGVTTWPLVTPTFEQEDGAFKILL